MGQAILKPKMTGDEYLAWEAEQTEKHAIPSQLEHGCLQDIGRSFYYTMSYTTNVYRSLRMRGINRRTRQNVSSIRM